MGWGGKAPGWNLELCECLQLEISPLPSPALVQARLMQDNLEL